MPTIIGALPEGLLKGLLEKLGHKEDPKATNKVEEMLKEHPSLQNAIDLASIIGINPEEVIADFQEFKNKNEALKTRLQLLVQSGKLETYTMVDLLSELEEGESAMYAAEPLMTFTLDEGQLLDKDGDIVPAFTQFLTGEYVLVKDYEKHMAKESTTKAKSEAIMVSKEVALQALSLGKVIEVEFTALSGKQTVMRFQKDDNTALPVEALVSGVFHIVQ